ncbi:HNH endonuclease [Nitratireductor aquimarinus]|uniref:HNH endonuclease n=1 Tax=Alphaproteobacteria TaxID=28211 RepID=UPI0019D3FE0C|nr:MULTISPECIES: HNH endonuclease signature motif containing protein [Alphaproteobacteria]MBN7758973.1 HNH endonuclease [Nitratireductor aquimarinus]MBY6001646.1 HNH endonuclease [Tritonibacter mobilis]MBY6023934.1 HNH endonuclease [Nitratireductor sp. DP7N14-4]
MPRPDPRSLEAKAYRPWYSTARWQKLRWSILVRDRFTCRRCKRVEPNTSLLVADHIKEHKGDERLFWDRDNLQSLCKHCHDSAKQSFEKTGRKRALIGLDGWPIDEG